MAGTAAGGDSRRDRINQTELAFLGETVQVRLLRLFQFRLSAHPVRQPAETVQDDKDDLLPLLLNEGGEDFMYVHSESPPEKEWLAVDGSRAPERRQSTAVPLVPHV